MPFHLNLILTEAQTKLKKSDVTTYKLDAEILLLHTLKLNKTDLITQGNNISITATQLQIFNNLIGQRIQHKPIAKIIGYKEFYSLNFKVNNYVLDPRPDTEILIDTILKLISDKAAHLNILDIGTGSGNIAITLATLLKNSKITALDISLQALETAIINAKQHQVSNQITFLQSNIFSKVTEKFDLIISNPPYIKTSDINKLAHDVKCYDPISALDGGVDGLEFYKNIAANSKKYLKNNGYIIIEIGYDQKTQIIDIFKEYNLYKSLKDYGGNDRCLVFKNY